jgi:type VI protein secretion system component VasF
MKISKDKKIMGEYSSGILSTIFLWGTFAIMAAAAVAMFFTLAH